MPYLRFCVREGLAPRSQWMRAGGGWLRQALRPSQVVVAKERSLSFIAGHRVEEMDALARRFFGQALQPRFFADGLREVERLKQAGYHIVVISASADVYMRVLPEFLPCEAVLATRCLTEDGRYTGRIEANCRGLQKYAAFLDYTREREAIIDRPALRSYGDSAGDIEMLQMAAEATIVNGSAKLLRDVPAAARVRWR